MCRETDQLINFQHLVWVGLFLNLCLYMCCIARAIQWERPPNSWAVVWVLSVLVGASHVSVTCLPNTSKPLKDKWQTYSPPTITPQISFVTRLTLKVEGRKFFHLSFTIHLFKLKKLSVQILVIFWASINRSSRRLSLCFIFSYLVHEEFLYRIKFLIKRHSCNTNVPPQMHRDCWPKDRGEPEDPLNNHGWVCGTCTESRAARVTAAATVLLPALAPPTHAYPPSQCTMGHRFSRSTLTGQEAPRRESATGRL